VEYEILDRVLVVRGNFEALSSGVDGGRRAVKNILNIQVSPDFSHGDPKSYIEGITASLTLKGDRLALLTAVEMKNVRILSDACVTVFVTAGLTNPSSFGTINIIVISSETLSEGAIVGTLITATEAKTRALIDKGLQFTGTTSDAIIVAYENSGEGEPILYSGLATPFGSRVAKLVRLGVKEALLKAHYGSDDVDKWKLSLGH
jgi:adenosylcobinamide hydrolase